MTALGVPIDAPGMSVHADRVWDSAAAKTLHLLERLRDFPSAWIRHVLLRHCLDACKVMHLLRSTPIGSGASAVASLSDALRQALADLVNVGMSDEAYAQATLPASLGGAGIKDPAFERGPARMAAICGFAMDGHSRVGCPQFACAAPLRDTAATIAALRPTLGPRF